MAAAWMCEDVNAVTYQARLRDEIVWKYLAAVFPAARHRNAQVDVSTRQRFRAFLSKNKSFALLHATARREESTNKNLQH